VQQPFCLPVPRSLRESQKELCGAPQLLAAARLGLFSFSHHRCRRFRAQFSEHDDDTARFSLESANFSGSVVLR